MVKTEHLIIELSARLNGSERGPGFWKLNTSILNEPEYKIEMKELINRVWEESVHISDVCTRFDWLKYHIRNFSIQYCKVRAQKKREREKYVVNELNYLYKKICEEMACCGEISRYNELKDELECIEEDKAKGVWIRSRLEYLENDEKSTCFFFNKSKS